MPDEKTTKKIKNLLDMAERNILEAKTLLFNTALSEGVKEIDQKSSDQKIIEGLFDGESMVGPENKHYPVPANYASKSKLVAGDMMKLTITEDGSFLFKQIGPVKRRKVVGVLESAAEGRYVVATDEGRFQVLPASVTYFKAMPGDQLTILIPEEALSEWAAVENKIV
jgi:hypothetical protein